jgi:hypothetical protein
MKARIKYVKYKSVFFNQKRCWETIFSQKLPDGRNFTQLRKIHESFYNTGTRLGDEVGQLGVEPVVDVARDGALAPPDVADHDEQRRPERDAHHDVVEPEPIADVLLQSML